MHPAAFTHEQKDTRRIKIPLRLAAKVTDQPNIAAHGVHSSVYTEPVYVCRYSTTTGRDQTRSYKVWQHL